VYVLSEGQRAQLAPRLAAELAEVDGVDLVIRREGETAVVWSERGELRFSPGDDLSDARGERWSLEGDYAALDLAVDGDQVRSSDYPEPLGRLWSALSCPRAGDVLVSASPGHEFTDWGGHDHVGGGSHGSLHRCDSLGALLMCGIGPSKPTAREQWSIEDATPLVLDHFGVEACP
jgi:hypothetical protein